MKALGIIEVSEVNGGFDLTAGPVGLGTALCGVVMTAGVNGAVGVTVETFSNPDEYKTK